MELPLRKAVLEDVPVLERLIADSVRALGKDDYTPAQIEAALGTAWGVDTQLILDGTYFVVESSGQIVACGGWSRRKTLFGADGGSGRDAGIPLQSALAGERARPNNEGTGPEPAAGPDRAYRSRLH